MFAMTAGTRLLEGGVGGVLVSSAGVLCGSGSLAGVVMQAETLSVFAVGTSSPVSRSAS